MAKCYVRVKSLWLKDIVLAAMILVAFTEMWQVEGMDNVFYEEVSPISPAVPVQHQGVFGAGSADPWNHAEKKVIALLYNDVSNYDVNGSEYGPQYARFLRRFIVVLIAAVGGTSKPQDAAFMLAFAFKKFSSNCTTLENIPLSASVFFLNHYVEAFNKNLRDIVLDHFYQFRQDCWVPTMTYHETHLTPMVNEICEIQRNNRDPIYIDPINMFEDFKTEVEKFVRTQSNDAIECGLIALMSLWVCPPLAEFKFYYYDTLAKLSHLLTGLTEPPPETSFPKHVADRYYEFIKLEKNAISLEHIYWLSFYCLDFMSSFVGAQYKPALWERALLSMAARVVQFPAAHRLPPAQRAAVEFLAAVNANITQYISIFDYSAYYTHVWTVNKIPDEVQFDEDLSKICTGGHVAIDARIIKELGLEGFRKLAYPQIIKPTDIYLASLYFVQHIASNKNPQNIVDWFDALGYGAERLLKVIASLVVHD